MKIVYCILGTYNSGGMERVLSNKANYLSRMGHQIYIVTTDQKHRTPFFKLEPTIIQIDLGVNYKDIAGAGILKKVFNYAIKQKQHQRKLSALLLDLHADVVISMFDHDATFLYKINDGSKKILEIHFSRFKRMQYARQGLWKLIDRYRSSQDLHVAGMYDHFVVLTEEDKQYWGGLRNIIVIPNANSFRPEKQADLVEKQVIAVGRYDEQKAFDELISAWLEISKKHPDWKLNIYGNGPLKADLQNLISTLNLHQFISLCEPVDNIETAYLKSSILVMTSRYEGLPMALLEGQACGLPLISYACKCGPSDIIHDGENGYLLAEGDRLGFEEKVIALMNNQVLRKELGNKSRQLSLHYTEEVIMKQWISILKPTIIYSTNK